MAEMAESSSLFAGPAGFTSSSSGGGPSSSEYTTSTTSLLQRLRRPKSSELARKRTVHRNHPPLGKRRCRGRGANEPKSVTPSQRVTEHPDECLTTSNKQLFCRTGREELLFVSSVVNNHLKSAKHQAGKQRLAAKEKSECDIAEALAASDKESHPVGETLPQNQRVYRLKL